MHPHELIKKYQVGKLRVSDVEKKYHEKKHDALNKSESF